MNHYPLMSYKGELKKYIIIFIPIIIENYENMNENMIIENMP